MSDPEIIYGRNPVEEAKQGWRKGARVWEAPKRRRPGLSSFAVRPTIRDRGRGRAHFPCLSGSDLLAGRTHWSWSPTRSRTLQPRCDLPFGRSCGGDRVVIPDRRAASGHRRGGQGFGRRGRASEDCPGPQISVTGSSAGMRASGSGEPTDAQTRPLAGGPDRQTAPSSAPRRGPPATGRRFVRRPDRDPAAARSTP